MKAMLSMTLLALICSGCATTRRAVNEPTVSAVRFSVIAARISTRKATGSAVRARVALENAAQAADRLLAGATPQQSTDGAGLRSALAAARAALDSTVAELTAATEALGDSEGRLGTLQQQIDAMSAELTRAQSARHAAEDRADFTRRVAWRLGFLSLALGIWTFRKPLLALGKLA